MKPHEFWQLYSFRENQGRQGWIWEWDLVFALLHTDKRQKTIRVWQERVNSLSDPPCTSHPPITSHSLKPPQTHCEFGFPQGPEPASPGGISISNPRQGSTSHPPNSTSTYKKCITQNISLQPHLPVACSCKHILYVLKNLWSLC